MSQSLMGVKGLRSLLVIEVKTISTCTFGLALSRFLSHNQRTAMDS